MITPTIAARSAGRRAALGGALGLAAAGLAGGLAAAQQRGGAAFPLRVSADRRCLEDAAGQPFLLHGDTAWSLIVQLRMEEAEEYLLDRQARGFNTLLVNLIEHQFASKAPANIYGNPPFGRGWNTGWNFGMPEEAYFAHADRVLQRAAELGFLVLLAPAYIGAGGGHEGWYREMVANGEAKLRRYGEFIGRRYRHLSNILWVHAGDWDPPNRLVVRAVAEGIRRHDQRSLHTVHCAAETEPLHYWTGEPWLQLNNVYSYGPIFSPALKQYQQAERMPFFLIESAYENEHSAGGLRIRTQAYHAMLCGASGHVFGNNPIWHFDAPTGIYAAPVTWRQALQGPGTQSMQHLLRLFRSFAWWHLEPDIDRALMSGDLRDGRDRAVAAATADGSFALCYLPSARTVVLDLSRLRGSRLQASWYDPATGRVSEVAQISLAAADRERFRSPERNGAGDTDWLLLLSTHA